VSFYKKGLKMDRELKLYEVSAVWFLISCKGSMTLSELQLILSGEKQFYDYIKKDERLNTIQWRINSSIPIVTESGVFEEIYVFLNNLLKNKDAFSSVFLRPKCHYDERVDVLQNLPLPKEIVSEIMITAGISHSIYSYLEIARGVRRDIMKLVNVIKYHCIHNGKVLSLNYEVRARRFEQQHGLMEW
jgi:hypothetical protein